MLANSIELDALIQVLFKKGIITEAELLDAVREMKQRMLGRARPGEHVMPADRVTTLRVLWCRRALIVRGFWI